jgi:hypothetical protein
MRKALTPTSLTQNMEKNSQFMTVNTSNPLKVCHQNIRGLFGRKKKNTHTQELLCSLLSDPPHKICLIEHHLKEYEIF